MRRRWGRGAGMATVDSASMCGVLPCRVLLHVGALGRDRGLCVGLRAVLVAVHEGMPCMDETRARVTDGTRPRCGQEPPAQHACMPQPRAHSQLGEGWGTAGTVTGQPSTPRAVGYGGHGRFVVCIPPPCRALCGPPPSTGCATRTCPPSSTTCCSTCPCSSSTRTTSRGTRRWGRVGARPGPGGAKCRSGLSAAVKGGVAVAASSVYGPCVLT